MFEAINYWEFCDDKKCNIILRWHEIGLRKERKEKTLIQNPMEKYRDIESCRENRKRIWKGKGERNWTRKGTSNWRERERDIFLSCWDIWGKIFPSKFWCILGFTKEGKNVYIIKCKLHHEEGLFAMIIPTFHQRPWKILVEGCGRIFKVHFIQFKREGQRRIKLKM